MYTDRVGTDDQPVIYRDDPLSVYLDAVRTVPPLQEGEAEGLFPRVRAGDEASKKRLIETHLHPVLPIAERHRSSGLHILELIETGNNRLIRAVETFTGASASGFAEYATAYIEKDISAAAAAGPIARSFPHLRDS